MNGITFLPVPVSLPLRECGCGCGWMAGWACVRAWISVGVGVGGHVRACMHEVYVCVCLCV